MKGKKTIYQIEYHCPECGSITPIMVGVTACIGCKRPLLIIQVPANKGSQQ